MAKSHHEYVIRVKHRGFVSLGAWIWKRGDSKRKTKLLSVSAEKTCIRFQTASHVTGLKPTEVTANLGALAIGRYELPAADVKVEVIDELEAAHG